MLRYARACDAPVNDAGRGTPATIRGRRDYGAGASGGGAKTGEGDGVGVGAWGIVIGTRTGSPRSSVKPPGTATFASTCCWPAPRPVRSSVTRKSRVVSD